MNSAVAKVLNKVLGEWVENLNSEQLNVSVFNGSISLKNLQLKSDLFNITGLPFDLHSGSIGELNATIPWASLTSSPLQIELSKLFLLIRPRAPVHWDTASQQKFNLQGKRSKIESFEAINSSELAVNPEPGFTEKLVAKIVDNLQITIKSIYIRYEDNTGGIPFAVGLALEEAVTFTCNDNWEEMFVVNHFATYKFAQMREFRVFMDYGECEIWSNQEFPERARAEIREAPEHRFIIEPTGFDLKITMNKDQSDLLKPQVYATLITKTFTLNINSIQTTFTLKFLEYLSLFSRFQKGVSRSACEREIAGREALEYRELYKQWRILTESKHEGKVAKKRLEQLEMGYSFESIVYHRKISSRELELGKQEDAIREEIKQLEKPRNAGTFAKFKGLFSKQEKSTEETQRETLAKQEKSRELSRITENREKLYSEMKQILSGSESFSNDLPSEYVKYLIELSVPSVSLRLQNDNPQTLIECSLSQMAVKIGLRPSSLYLHSAIASSLIRDTFSSSQKITEIFIGKSLKFQYDTLSFTSVTITSEGALIIANFAALATLANAFIPAVLDQIDWGPLIEVASVATAGYIQAGQEYMEEIVSHGVKSSLALEITAKAPVFMIPLDLSAPEAGLLVLDFGEIRSWTGQQTVSGSQYDQYNIEISNIKACIVLNNGDVREWDQGEKREIIDPAKISFVLLNCKDSVSQAPTVIIDVKVGSISLLFNDEIVSFAVLVARNTESELCKLKRVEKKKYLNQEIQGTIQETRLKDRVKGLSIVSMKVSLNIENFVLNLGHEGSALGMFRVDGLSTVFSVVDSLKIQGKSLIKDFSLVDMRESTAFSRVICNPLPTTSAISITFDLDPQKDFIHIGVSLKALRAIIHPEFISQILEAFTSQFNIIESLTLRQEAPQTPKTEYTTTLKTKLSLDFDHLELWAPLDVEDRGSLTGCLYLGISVEFSSEGTFVSVYSTHGRSMKHSAVSTNEEAQVIVKKIGGVIGYIQDDQVVLPNGREQALLDPIRISLTYNYHKRERENPMTSLSIDIEPICSALGLRDVQYFIGIVEVWKILKIPIPKHRTAQLTDVPVGNGTTSVKFAAGALDFFLIEDTSPHCYSQVRLKLTNASGGVTIQNSIKSAISVCIMCEFFNIDKNTWEPFIEDWGFRINFAHSQEEISLDIISDSVLNINFTVPIAKVAGKLMKKLQNLGAVLEKGSGVSQLRNPMYIVKNLLGVPIQIWFEGRVSYEIFSLAAEETVELSSDMMNRAFAVAQQGLIDDIRTPVSIGIVIDGYSPVKGLSIENIKTFGFSLESDEIAVDCLMRVYIEYGSRIIELRTNVLCMNSLAFPIELTVENERIEIPGATSRPIPFHWTDKDPIISSTENFYGNSVFELDGKRIAKSVLRYSTDNDFPQIIISLTPFYIIENKLPCLLSLIYNEGTLATIHPGKQQSLYERSPSDFTFKLSLENNAELMIEPTQINERISYLQTHGNFPSAQITAEIFPTEPLLMNSTEAQRLSKTSHIQGKSIVIYSQFIIVNRTKLTIETGEVCNVIIKGNSLGFYQNVGDTMKLRLAEQAAPGRWSQGFNIKAIGISGVLELDNSGSQEPNSVKTVLVGVKLQEAAYPIERTRIIYILPRFLLTNYLFFPIFIKQKGSPLLLETTATSEFQIENHENVSISRDNATYSFPFSIEDIEDFQIKFPSFEEEKQENGEWYMPNPTNNFTHIARVVVTTEDEATLHVSILHPNVPEFIIYNATSDEITVKQGNFPHVTVPPLSKIPWVFDDLQNNRKVQIRLDSRTMVYSIEKAKQMKPLGKYEVDVTVTGVSRELRIYPKDSSFPQTEQQFHREKNYTIATQLTGIGISIIDVTPNELFYLTFQGITFTAGLHHRTSDTGVLSAIELDFTLQDLQLDNMRTNVSLFPVILSRAIPDLDKEFIPFIQAKLHKHSIRNSSIDKITWLEFLIQEIHIKINQETIQELINLFEQILPAFFNTMDSAPLYLETYSFTDVSSMLSSRAPSFSYDSVTHSSKVYVEFARLCAMKFIVTFRVPSSKTDLIFSAHFGFPLFRFLNAIGSSLITITDSPLYFSEIIFTYSFQTPSNLIWTILENYKRQGILQFYKVLGSSDLIGNPIGLINKLGTGVIEFISEPSKGILKGPKSFAEGVQRGVRSLVGNVVSGSFGSVSKITGSMYGIIKKVGGDEEAAKKINESGGALGKIGGGIKGGASDIIGGVTGVFTKPWKGVKKGGIKGFFKGVGSGAVGLLTSPVSAVLNVGTGLTSGISDAATILAKGTVSLKGRVRFPRYISERGVIENYHLKLAETQELLGKLHEGKLVLYVQICEELIVLVTMRSLLVIQSGEVRESLGIENVDNCEVVRKGAEYFLKVKFGESETVIRSFEHSDVVKLYYAICMVPGSKITPNLEV